MQLQHRYGNFSKHLKVFSTYSCHQKKERISQVFSLQKEENQDTEQWCSHLYITQQSAMPEISSILHTGESWKQPRNTQLLKVMKNCSTNPNNMTSNETKYFSRRDHSIFKLPKSLHQHKQYFLFYQQEEISDQGNFSHSS